MERAGASTGTSAAGASAGVGPTLLPGFAGMAMPNMTLTTSGIQMDKIGDFVVSPTARQHIDAGLALVGAGGSEEKDEEGHTLVRLPGVGCKAVVDDDDAIIVFVLTKFPQPNDEEEAGGFGCAAPDESSDDDSHAGYKALPTVQEPGEKAKQVFLKSETLFPNGTTWATSPGAKAGEATPGTSYQRMMRRALERVIVHVCGFRLKCKETMDGEGVFWKISASEDRLQDLAEKYNYMMAYSKEQAYDAVGVEVPMVGGVEMRAHAKFQKAHAKEFVAFSSMDQIRLVTMELLSHVNLHELQEQSVIERWFPAAKHQEMEKLAKKVVGWPFGKVLFCPQPTDAGRIRAYFGEEVGIFFSFYNTFIRALRWPALFALIVTLVDKTRPPIPGFTEKWERCSTNAVFTLYALYGCFVILWAIWFFAKAEHGVNWDLLRWGSAGQMVTEVQVKSYEPKDRRNVKQAFFDVLGKAITFVFLLVVAVTCCVLSLVVPTINPHPRAVSLVQTATTFAFSFVWGKVAKQIVTLENKRTQARFNQSLTMRLAFVKMFIFFFPLVRLAFLAPVAQRHCAMPGSDGLPQDNFYTEYYKGFNTDVKNNLEEMSVKATDERFKNWVDTLRITHKNYVDRAFMVLTDKMPFESMEEDIEAGATEAQCYRGCYPVYCEKQTIDGKDTLHCVTTCFDNLRRYLVYLYITHCVCTLSFIVIPMIQVRRLAKREIAKAASASEDEEEHKYTLLHYQEKCHMQAAYEYESWGGSYVEDFLEVVLGFSVLVCFSIVSPAMAMIGLFAQLAEYRLLVYRMTWVTCRPFPVGSEGLKEWLGIMNVTLYVAIGLNSMLLVYAMRTRLDHFPPGKKVLVIFGLTLGLIAVKVIMGFSLSEHPREVQEAMDENHEFEEKLRLSRRDSREGTTTRFRAKAKIGVEEE